MSLVRITLGPDDPEELIPCDNYEMLVYPLIGDVEFLSSDVGPFRLTGRASVTQKPKRAIRVLNDTEDGHDFILRLTGRTRYADLLITHLDIANRPGNKHGIVYDPIVEFIIHHVGKGNYRRQVRVLDDQREPFQIFAGETLNQVGGWSSFPPHANATEAGTKFDQWQELFYHISNRYSLMCLDGYYTDGSRAEGARLIPNNFAFTTPLGSHPIVSAPDGWSWYFWAYQGNSIEKAYNTQAHHVGTYVK